jgi:hypothetical protein
MYAAQQAPAQAARPSPTGVERAAADPGEQHHAGCGEHDPDQVEQTPRPRHRDRQRPGELHRHRHPDGDAVDRRVERAIERGQHDAEGDHQQDLAAAAAAQPGPREHEQHERADAEPQQHRAEQPRAVEQRLRQRGAELD